MSSDIWYSYEHRPSGKILLHVKRLKFDTIRQDTYWVTILFKEFATRGSAERALNKVVNSTLTTS